MRCENCGNENPEGSKFCIKCGKELGGPAPSVCPVCGAQIAAGALFCASCGKSVGAPYGEVTQGRTHDALPPLPDPESKSFTSSIAMDIVLSLITCGIYWFFWQARQMRAINHLLGQQRYNFWMWFLLAIVTCGLYNIYYEYYMSQELVEAQDKHGLPKSKYLPVLSLFLTIIGLNIVTDAIQQNEINKFFER